jgi:hypothetical protein
MQQEEVHPTGLSEQPDIPYIFTRGQRGIFAEIYFPKRITYQGEIFRAIEEGIRENEVKDYLTRNISGILLELVDYPDLFDPRKYQRNRIVQHRRIRREEALRRIAMYRSYFKGWSMYEVDGMFLNETTQNVDEERTQVIRLIFRPESSFLAVAREKRCYDVLEAIIDWATGDPGRLDGQILWSNRECARFMASLEPWPRVKREFAQEYFEPIAKEVSKWIDDCALFIFAYLVRRFWEEVLRVQRREDQIWVTSFFNLNINIVQRIESQESL